MKDGKAVAARVMEEITGEPKEICEGYVESTEELIGVDGLEGKYTPMEVEGLVNHLVKNIRNVPDLEAQLRSGMKNYKSRRVN